MNLEEIKAREQAARPGPWEVGDGSKQSYRLGKNAVVSRVFGNIASKPIYRFPNSEKYNEHVYADMDFIAHSRTDIPELISEVERLTAEVKCLDNECCHYRRLSREADQQIATLKKALELASSEVNTAFETLVEHHVLTLERKASSIQDNVDAWIQKAEQAQRTHETQEESCHTCQKISGCPLRRFEPNDYEPCAEYQAQGQEEKK